MISSINRKNEDVISLSARVIGKVTPGQRLLSPLPPSIYLRVLLIILIKLIMITLRMLSLIIFTYVCNVFTWICKSKIMSASWSPNLKSRVARYDVSSVQHFTPLQCRERKNIPLSIWVYTVVANWTITMCQWSLRCHTIISFDWKYYSFWLSASRSIGSQACRTSELLE